MLRLDTCNDIDNCRFTLSVIGNIDKRALQLEYYTALTLLEKEANDLSIMDSASGTDGLKSVADEIGAQYFVGDVSNEDFKAAIDFELKELRPSFSATITSADQTRMPSHAQNRRFDYTCL